MIKILKGRSVDPITPSHLMSRSYIFTPALPTRVCSSALNHKDTFIILPLFVTIHDFGGSNTLCYDMSVNEWFTEFQFSRRQ